MPTASIPKGTSLAQGQGGTSYTSGNSHMSGYGRGSSPGTSYWQPNYSTYDPNTGLKKGAQKARGRSGRLRNARAGTRGTASGISTRLNSPAANAARARANANIQSGFGRTPTNLPKSPPITNGSAALAGGAGATALGAGSTSAAGALGLTPVASAPLGATVSLGAAALGLGLAAGNTIYEGMGRPFGPSLGDYLGGLFSPPSPSRSQGLPGAIPGDIVDSRTWGETGKEYDVTYRTARTVTDDDGNTSWVWFDPKLEEGVSGPIGVTQYSSPESSTGKHKYIGVTSPDGANHSFEEFAERNIVFGTGTNNYEGIDIDLEILNVVEVGGSGTGVPPTVTPTTSPRTSPLTLPVASPENFPTTPEQPHTPYEPYIPELTPLPTGVPTLPDGSPDIKGNPVLPGESKSNQPAASPGRSTSPAVEPTTSPTSTEGRTTTGIGAVPTSTTNINDPLLPGNPSIYDPTNPNKVVPTPAIEPELEPLPDTELDPDSVLGRLSQLEEQYGNPLSGLFIPALASPQPTDLLQENKTPNNPNLPPTSKGGSCGCNGAINTHTSNVAQELSDKIDGLNPLSGVDLSQLGLLATILEVVSSVAGAVGVNAFPISAPANLNQSSTGTKTINNLAEAHLWQTENLDSTIGGWPNSIQNLDDGSTLENLTVSDSLAEIQGMLMAMAIGQGINQQGIFKTLTETTGIKQQSMLARQFSQANAEYLGYNLRQTTRSVPNTYTPGVENILELLNPGHVPMEAVENVDDMDLQTCLRELCASAAIIRAVFFRNTGTGDIEQALKEKIDQARAVNDTAGNSDFEEYLSQVEQGFGLPTPYGRDETQGPKLSDRTDSDTP